MVMGSAVTGASARREFDVGFLTFWSSPMQFRFLLSLLRAIGRFDRLGTGVAVGVVLLCELTFAPSTLAQSLETPFDRRGAIATEPSQTRLLYVDPVRGSDRTESGSAETPFGTITRALAVAQPNTVIILSRGTYSTQTGEIFPIRLKSGVTLYGNPEERGRQVVIFGGGTVSTASGTQRVAIVGVDGAGLNGVTVSNPEGHGVWVESGSPWVVNSRFSGNGGRDIAVTANGRPVLQNNVMQNDSNAMENRADRATVAQRSTENSDGVAVVTWGSRQAFRLDSGSRPRLNNKPQIAYRGVDRPFSIPQATLGTLPPLPVPNSSPPLGDRGDLPLPSTEVISLVPGAPPPPPAYTDDLVTARLRYRILVVPRNSTEASLVRLVVPDAFTVRHSDGSFTQAGAFRNRDRAERVLQQLHENGLNARLEELP
ncbi:Serine/threonine protein kinase [Geitlerinema sp. FC II]|nr:Serine/threonine protein kinase [Geitlerinema sp. FC II]